MQFQWLRIFKFCFHVSSRSPRAADWYCTGNTLRHTLLYESLVTRGSKKKLGHGAKQFTWLTCGTHTLCVSGGAQHSPAQMQRSLAKIYMNLYVLYTPDSSRCIVVAIFHRKCSFSISRRVFWKFQTTCSGSSRCSFWLRIAQNSSSLNKSKTISRLSFDSK